MTAPEVKGTVEGEPTAVLYIGWTSSQCGNCRLGTDPYAVTHDKILGYRNNGAPACGARFTSMMNTYAGTDDKIREMRPDLPIHGTPSHPTPPTPGPNGTDR